MIQTLKKLRFRGQTLAERIVSYPQVSYKATAIGYNKLPKAMQTDGPAKRGDTSVEPAEVKGQWAHKIGSVGGPVVPNNINTHEYLSMDSLGGDLKTLNEDLYEHKSKIDNEREDRIYQSVGYEPSIIKFNNVLKMPSVLCWFTMMMMGGVSIVFILGSILGAIWGAIDSPSTILSDLYLEVTTQTDDMIFLVSPIILFLITRFLWKSGLAKLIDPKMPIHVALKRDTGMIRFIKGIDDYVDVPFTEFEARYTTMHDGGNRIMAKLYLAHKRSKKSFIYGAPHKERWYVGVAWEFLQHYMDVSRPLPDVPQFEPFRHLDPTTAAWDKKHGRPERLWRDMPHEQYYQLCRASVDAALEYPYQDPAAAKAQGWQPAGDGNHWYQRG